jgi:hypothetical protein
MELLNIARSQRGKMASFCFLLLQTNGELYSSGVKISVPRCLLWATPHAILWRV